MPKGGIRRFLRRLGLMPKRKEKLSELVARAECVLRTHDWTRGALFRGKGEDGLPEKMCLLGALNVADAHKGWQQLKLGATGFTTPKVAKALEAADILPGDVWRWNDRSCYSKALALAYLARVRQRLEQKGL